MKIISLVNHSLCPELLKPGAVVLDLGANLGDFANEVARIYHCRVYAVEASTRIFNQIVLPANSLVKKFNVAICAESGPVSLNVSSNSEATSLKRLNNAEYVDVVTVQGMTLAEFVRAESVPGVDMLKVDIEGAEIEVFSTCLDDFLQSIDQITVEFHEWLGVSSPAEVENVIHRLRRLGFYSFKLTRKDYSDVLFVHSRRMSFLNYIFTLSRVWIPRVIRYAERHLSKNRKSVETAH